MFWDKLFRRAKKEKDEEEIPNDYNWVGDSGDTEDTDESEDTQDPLELTGKLPVQDDDPDFKIVLEIVVTCSDKSGI